MDLHLDLTDTRPLLSAQIYRGLVDAIVDGRLQPGQRLPSSRALADDLSVARSTVVYAYERLTAEGFAVSRVGRRDLRRRRAHPSAGAATGDVRDS